MRQSQKDVLYKNKFNSPECKTIDVVVLEQNNEFNPTKTSTKMIKYCSVRNSLNENKFSEKSKKRLGSKEKCLTGKAKRRPGSATEKTKDRKFVK